MKKHYGTDRAYDLYAYISEWEAEGSPDVIVGIYVRQFGICQNEGCQGQLFWADGTVVMDINQGYFDMKFVVNILRFILCMLNCVLYFFYSPFFLAQ